MISKREEEESWPGEEPATTAAAKSNFLFLSISLSIQRVQHCSHCSWNRASNQFFQVSQHKRNANLSFFLLKTGLCHLVCFLFATIINDKRQTPICESIFLSEVLNLIPKWDWFSRHSFLEKHLSLQIAHEIAWDWHTDTWGVHRSYLSFLLHRQNF